MLPTSNMCPTYDVKISICLLYLAFPNERGQCNIVIFKGREVRRIK